MGTRAVHVCMFRNSHTTNGSVQVQKRPTPHPTDAYVYDVHVCLYLDVQVSRCRGI